MKRFLVFCLFFLTISSLYGEDEGFLLDDFNDGNDRNKLNLYWFYFSDVNDSGTSQINNAEYLGNGAYSRVKPVLKDTQSADYWAKMEFTMGDLFPCQKRGSFSYCGRYEDAPQFVGIGTDISLTKEGIDISEFDSISFDVYLVAGIRPEGVIEFNIISDYGIEENWKEEDKNNFFHSYLSLSLNEQHHIVVKKEEMMFYLWGERGKRARGQKDYVTNYLRKSYKMTWRILGGDEEWLISNGTGGIFYLDNIRIYPSSIFMSQVNNNKISRPTITCVKDETFLNSTIFSDFLGRKIEISKNHTISNLPFVYRNYQKSNKKVLRLK